MTRRMIEVTKVSKHEGVARYSREMALTLRQGGRHDMIRLEGAPSQPHLSRNMIQINLKQTGKQ
jgi:hypothetical protein